MQNATNVLIIDSQTSSRTALAERLRSDRFQVIELTTCDDLGAASGETNADCIIVQLQAEGLDTCRAIRDFRAADGRPLIAVDDRDEPLERIVALELGADDVIARRTDPREVAARLKAILRRGRIEEKLDPTARAGASVLRFGKWAIDMVQRRVFAPGAGDVAMTSGEFDILKCFVEKPLRPITREQILEATRSGRSFGYDRSIDVLIGRIRRKLEDDPGRPRLIQTVHGVGYVMTSLVYSHQSIQEI
jgi:two-component system OmpR family response regulator